MSEITKGHVVELVYKNRSPLGLVILTTLTVVTLSVLPVSPWHHTGVTGETRTQTNSETTNTGQDAAADKVAPATTSQSKSAPVVAVKKDKPVTVKVSKAKARKMKIVAAQAMQALGIPVKNDASYAGLSKLQASTVLSIHHHFGEKLFSKAVRIAWCESRLNPTATNRNRNGTTDHGVFQINDGGTMQGLGINRRQAMLLDTNVNAAKKLYDDRGWQPWVCNNA